MAHSMEPLWSFEPKSWALSLQTISICKYNVYIYIIINMFFLSSFLYPISKRLSIEPPIRPSVAPGHLWCVASASRNVPDPGASRNERRQGVLCQSGRMPFFGGFSLLICLTKPKRISKKHPFLGGLFKMVLGCVWFLTFCNLVGSVALFSRLQVQGSTKELSSVELHNRIKWIAPCWGSRPVTRLPETCSSGR